VPTINDDAVCIRHWDYSETSQTVSLFSREHGIIRGLAKGAKREKGRFSGGIDLLARGEVIAIVKPGRDLATITDWNLVETFWPLRHRLDAHRAALYVADVVHQMVTDHDPHPALFDAFLLALGRFGAPASRDGIILRFLWALLKESGYQPDVGAGPVATRETFHFDPATSRIQPDRTDSRGWRVRAETVAVLRGLDRAVDDPSDPGSITRAARLLSAQIRHLLGKEPPTLRLVYPDLEGPPV
jgi:DNA repair protein RecO (recombination protein O)